MDLCVGNSVSCILPATLPGSLLEQSIDYFLRQNFASKQLIILSFDDQPLAGKWNSHPCIQTVLTPTGKAVEKTWQNAWDTCTGRWIAWWDPSDWIGSDRLSSQTAGLTVRGAAHCVSSQVQCFSPQGARAWHGDPNEQGRLARKTWLCDRHAGAGSITASAFLELALRPLSFFRQYPAIRFATPWHIAIEAASVSTSQLDSGGRRSSFGMGNVTQLMGEDRDFYARLRFRLAPQTRRRDRVKNQPAPDLAGSLSSPSPSPYGPKVSCIMPTYNRRDYVPSAIRGFLAQTYPFRELIIVDDGPDSVVDLIPDDPRILYIRLNARRSIGIKRNLAVEASTGEIAICWDDDDWFSPNRVTYQVSALLAGGAEATALQVRYVYDRREQQFWSGAPEQVGPLFLNGVNWGTLAWLRSAQRREPNLRFPDSSLGEDVAFQELLIRSGARVRCLENPGVYVYVRHGQNTWAFSEGRALTADRWSRISPPAFIPADDLNRLGVDQASRLTLQT